MTHDYIELHSFESGQGVRDRYISIGRIIRFEDAMGAGGRVYVEGTGWMETQETASEIIALLARRPGSALVREPRRSALQEGPSGTYRG